MTNEIYTVITFAPVQGFIEKSRKLRDLYGSSYLLSYISWVICNAAEEYSCECKVVSPALPNITQGMPNQIIIKGNFPKENAFAALLTAWKCITETCREWIEDNVGNKEDYVSWRRIWGLWTKYAWEFFWVQGKPGESISKVREKLNEKKRARDWTGINWQGESSTLSGADAIAYPKLGFNSDPRKYNYQQEKDNVRDFYTALSEKLGESFIKSVNLKVPDEEMSQRSQEYGKSFIDPDEELSVPELIKRLITHNVIAEKLTERLKNVYGNNGLILKNLAQQINQLSDDLNPTTFKDLRKFGTGWFQGDGDKASEYLKSFAHTPQEAQETQKFSREMREWGSYFQELPKNRKIENWRVIYAGGDDFLGVFYNRKNADDCVTFFSKFKSDTWNQPHPKEITVSVGFVWASPGIPQRDVLQHCREAEKSAKTNGRDRIAFRILFNNGNHLEWVCPWRFLEAGLLSNYQDREGKQNWTHIYNDVAVLESRHALGRRYNDDDEDEEDNKDDSCQDTGIDVALPLFKIYFPNNADIFKQENLWNPIKEKDEEVEKYEQLIGGILGERKRYYHKNTEVLDQNKVDKALTNWIINLAKVGFHLCQQ
ncbi:Cas10/Cmr2 second palm domain-containing protein [Calothrix sp. CCY 0018]|uniref:Cas10/Cmr2 second palm domain-containing protein n=1 Tax=Calothrix sp. CCY 0018 TaxID=3103864 RepID=UPI0039C6C479